MRGALRLRIIRDDALADRRMHEHAAIARIDQPELREESDRSLRLLTLVRGEAELAQCMHERAIDAHVIPLVPAVAELDAHRIVTKRAQLLRRQRHDVELSMIGVAHRKAQLARVRRERGLHAGPLRDRRRDRGRGPGRRRALAELEDDRHVDHFARAHREQGLVAHTVAEQAREPQERPTLRIAREQLLLVALRDAREPQLQREHTAMRRVDVFEQSSIDLFVVRGEQRRFRAERTEVRACEIDEQRVSPAAIGDRRELFFRSRGAARSKQRDRRVARKRFDVDAQKLRRKSALERDQRKARGHQERGVAEHPVCGAHDQLAQRRVIDFAEDAAA